MKRRAPGSARIFPIPALHPSGKKLCGLTVVLSCIFLSTLLLRAAPEEGCDEILKSRCTVCHYLTRVCQKLEKEQNKGLFGSVFAGSWGRTIKNMVNQGAKLTETEQEKLTRCLDTSAPSVMKVCGLNK